MTQEVGLAPPDSRARLALGLGLTALGGMLDAVGYDRLDHLFLSFMSGNSVHLGIALSGLQANAAALALAIIASFVAGSFLGEMVRSAVAPTQAVALLLGTQSATMLAAAGAAQAGSTHGALALAALGLGVQNVVTLPYKGVALGRTYLSGSLVEFGEALASMVRGSGRTAMAFILFAGWVSFVLGVVIGSAIAPLDLAGILLGVSTTLGAMAVSARRLSAASGTTSSDTPQPIRDQTT